MNKKSHMPSIDITFERLLGIAPPDGFGEPFATAFAKLYNGKDEEVATAAYTCSLFLSAVLEQYPTARLHTFVHHIQENYSRFSFDCNMYGTIFKEMDEKSLRTVCLLKDGNIPTVHNCSKEDIFEAFDFYTNR